MSVSDSSSSQACRLPSAFIPVHLRTQRLLGRLEDRGVVSRLGTSALRGPPGPRRAPASLLAFRFIERSPMTVMNKRVDDWSNEAAEMSLSEHRQAIKARHTKRSRLNAGWTSVSL